MQLWKRLWRERPSEMEETRHRAVAAARHTYLNRQKRLETIIKDWPDLLTNKDLRDRCALRAPEFGFKARSLKIKATRLGLIRYDHERGVWINATKINTCKSESDSPNEGA